MTTKVAFAGTRYGILDATTAIENITQNVALPADADIITLGFRVKVNRAPSPDLYDRLFVRVLDLSNNLLGTVSTIIGDTDTNQPQNYRGYMPVKVSYAVQRADSADSVPFAKLRHQPHFLLHRRNQRGGEETRGDAVDN